ncbi:MAG: hypothetical protein ACT4QC_20940 [Planctomycetaceae bacterium]
MPALLLAALLGLGGWFLWPAPIDVTLTVEGYKRYDDVAGHRPLAAIVRVTNRSRSAVWYRPSVVGMVETVDGRSLSSHTSLEPVDMQWTPLAGLSSMTLEAGPLRNEVESVRIGIPLTNDRILVHCGWLLGGVPKTVNKPFVSKREWQSVHWVYTKELKPDRDYYPDPTVD